VTRAGDAVPCGTALAMLKPLEDVHVEVVERGDLDDLKSLLGHEA
jgi:hypothetical protein